MTAILQIPRQVREIENLFIPLSDGCRLAARLWLPEDAEDNPVPAILEYLPYRKRDGTADRDEKNHPYIAAQGYACIPVDMRGNGESDGLMLDEYLKQSRRVLKVVGEYLHRRLTDMGAVVQKPEGAFYLFPDFSNFREALARRDIKTSQALCQSLLENTGVAILPASDFGFVPDHLAARLAFVDFDGAEALALAGKEYGEQELSDDFVKQACPRLVTAMDKMEQWLTGL